MVRLQQFSFLGRQIPSSVNVFLETHRAELRSGFFWYMMKFLEYISQNVPNLSGGRRASPIQALRPASRPERRKHSGTLNLSTPSTKARTQQHSEMTTKPLVSYNATGDSGRKGIRAWSDGVSAGIPLKTSSIPIAEALSRLIHLPSLMPLASSPQLSGN